MQVAEAVIFQLPFELTNTETVGQWRIDIGALFGGQYPLIFRRIFHFAQVHDAFSQLQHYAAEIFHHRQQHAADVIHLFRGHGVVVDRFQLADGVHIAHAVYQRDNAFADGGFQLLFTHHFIVSQRENQRRTQAFDIHAEH